MAATLDLGSSARKGVGVRLPPPALVEGEVGWRKAPTLLNWSSLLGFASHSGGSATRTPTH